MIGRIVTVLFAGIVLIDVIACYLWLAALHPFGLSDAPNGHQMISSYVGRAAINGHRWAIRAERVIDWLFERLGEEPWHCRRWAERVAGFGD